MGDSRYRVGPEPAKDFTKVPRSVIATLEDPVALGVLVWIMHNHPNKHVTREQVIHRFHIPRVVSRARIIRAWQALKAAGYLVEDDRRDRRGQFRKVTIRTWEPSTDHAKYRGSPSFGSPTNVVPLSSDARRSVARRGKELDVDLRQEDTGAAGTRTTYACPLCRGTGQRRTQPCSRCAGVGQVAL